MLPAHTLSLGQYAWRLSVLASQICRLPYFPLHNALSGAYLYHATEHLLPLLRVPTVMTVHDLIFERFPQHHTPTNRAFLRVAMPLFVRSATRIIAVSRHTASDLVSLYGVGPEKIHVIYEGIDTRFRRATHAQVKAVQARYNLQRPYLLMVGTLEPRKNHRLALAALARLKAQGYNHQLVIAGGKGWLFKPISAAVASLGLSEDVVFAGYVPDGDLPALYTGADALLMPSLYEGFGFPMLEAMACGTPVICSRASSLPELAGNAALLIDPDDDESFVSAIRQVADNVESAASMRVQGLEQAARFTWEATAAQTAQLYHAVAEEGSHS
jgi:glycosyltransferase involved in cell wall biosynthesis